jgi:ribosomal protein S18 acetylase RimI-like enzyme
MSIEIEPIQRRHIAGFREVLDAVARERRYLALTEAPPMSQVRRFVLGNLKSGTAQFVAVEDQRVVAWCDVRPKPREALRHSGTLGMGVLASHRGQGIGTRLMAATLEAAEANGLCRIELLVRADNEAAIALYRRFGFDTEGTCRRYMQMDGLWFDALLMARLGKQDAAHSGGRQGTFPIFPG